MSDAEITASRLRILVEKAVSTENPLVLISPYVDSVLSSTFLLRVSYMCDKANCLLAFAFSSLSVKIPVVLLLLLFLFYF